MNSFKLTFSLLIILFLIFIVNIWKNIKSNLMNKIIHRNSGKISDRQYWVEIVHKISFPLLNPLSKGELKN